MSTPLNQNQFKMLPVAGMVDQSYVGSVINAEVSLTEATALVAGTAVKIENTAGGVPKITALTANTDVAFGVITRNAKDANYPAGAMVELAQFGTAIYMTASGAIARGGFVEYDYSTGKVGPAGFVNPVLGYAFDKADANGDTIRVVIQVPNTVAAGTPSLVGAIQTARVTATLAEINAGKVIVPATTGKQIRVVNFAARVSGAFTTTTSVDLQGGTSNTKVAVLAQAQLTNGAVLVPASTGVTLGAGFAADLTASESLKVVNTGTAAAGGTSITYTVSYVLI